MMKMILKTLVIVLLFILPQAYAGTTVTLWNQAALDAVKKTKTSDVAAARALGILHTAIYNAWSLYDGKSNGTQGGIERRPPIEQTAANKNAAISYAAYRALVDLFPTEKDSLDKTLKDLGYDPNNQATELTTPAGVGNTVAKILIDVRHKDGSNQLGDVKPGAYSDYTDFAPINTPDKITDITRWQPLKQSDGNLQRFNGAQWRLVQPFALVTASEFRPNFAPIPTGDRTLMLDTAQQTLDISAGLTEYQKAVAEHWALNSGTETPPGYWALLAQWLSEKRKQTLDDDVQLFFILGNTLHDAAIAIIDTKVYYNSARPEPLIQSLYKGKKIRAWGGPDKGTQIINGEDWKPYLPTSPSPEHISGHSAFSAAAAEIFRLYTGSDDFGYSTTFPAGKLKMEKGPQSDITFNWPTFSAAVNEAGLSRVYGGIHFWSGDVYGRMLGVSVARKVWNKALGYISPK
jgi:hypothetical protein